MRLAWARAACSRPALSGVPPAHLGELLEELAPRWQAARESALHERRGGDRKRAAGAGPKQRLVFVDRLLAHSSTCGLGSRTESVGLRIDGTEVPVRRPRAHRSGRKAFVSGKKKQNTIKTTTFSDPQGRTLFSGVVRPGRMHDRTAVRTEGIAEQFHRHPKVKAEVDEGYRGLANEFPGQVSAPPKKPKGDAPLGEHGTGARPAGRLLITHQPTRQAGTPRTQSLPRL